MSTSMQDANDGTSDSPFSGTFLPTLEDPPGAEEASGMHQSVSSIDVTGATISQEWSLLPTPSEEGERYQQCLVAALTDFKSYFFANDVLRTT